MAKVESLKFRQHARKNCYKYGELRIHTDSPISLDQHNFPNFHQSEGGSSLEEFIGLVNTLKNVAQGNSSSMGKIPRLLPTIKWDGDTLDMSLSINGTMYFEDADQYVNCKSTLAAYVKRDGWKTSTESIGGGQVATINVTTYKPNRETLYADDPLDAAGRGMIFRSAQHATAQMKVTSIYLSSENDDSRAQDLAIAQANIDAQNAFEDQPLGGFGFIGNIKAGLMALGANTSGGMLNSWSNSGRQLELVVDDKTVQTSIPMVMKSATFTESALVVDDKGRLYPTAMDVSLTLMNAYGSLLTAMN